MGSSLKFSFDKGGQTNGGRSECWRWGSLFVVGGMWGGEGFWEVVGWGFGCGHKRLGEGVANHDDEMHCVSSWKTSFEKDNDASSTKKYL